MGEHTPWPHDETLHAWWVEPGRLLASEYRGMHQQLRAEPRWAQSAS